MTEVVRFLAVGLLLGSVSCVQDKANPCPTPPAGRPAAAQKPLRPRKIYAHHMGCYPVAAKATAYMRLAEAHKVRHDGNGQFDAIGDRWRNWPLAPEGTNLTVEQSADLDIRRALRGGIDGFAMDAWAGGGGAREVFDAMFKLAEEKDYPFEITICIDCSCLPGDKGSLQAAVDAIRYVLNKHGKSPKLARRNGKPLIFTYQGIWEGLNYATETARKDPSWRDKDANGNSRDLRCTPEGWELIGQGYDEIRRRIGQPLFIHFGMGAFFHGLPGQSIGKDMPVQAATVMARHVQAVGEFIGGGPMYDRMARAVQAAGAEWSEPMWFQYENIGWGNNHLSMGADILRDRWKRARENGSTLIQFITWNDYTENTCLAPAYETRYAILDLNAYFVKWWKTGAQPVPDHDRMYLLYRKYPKGVRIFPFKPRQPDAGGMLEVLTILPKPAHIRLPGRGAEYDAPAGMSWKQFPLSAGPVVAEIVRKGHVDARLESPEPITDRPFREQNGMTCYSTEFMRHWKADFGDAKPWLHGEYADADHNGLPNWFEMYWFGKFLDYSTATGHDPNALTPSGKALRQAYLDRTDPTVKPIPYSEIPTQGLLAWYRADKGIVADANGRISQWQDQSPNKLNQEAKTETQRPRLLEKSPPSPDGLWNGLPVVEFDGVQNSLICPLPKKDFSSMTVIAVFAAKAREQVFRAQEGINNRLISIPTNHRADYEGGIALGVSTIYYPSGDVAVATRKQFAPGGRPVFIGVGSSIDGRKPSNRAWFFKGKVGEILVYSPALTEAETRKVVSILKARYKM